MTEANTQAVVDAPVPALPGTTAQDAPKDDLASLLSEFEQNAEPAPQPQPVPQKTAAQPDPAIVERFTAYEAREEKRDINEAVKAIRGKNEHVSDRLVKGWLNAAAEENPKLKDVFANRINDPAKWEKALGALTREFEREQSKLPDKETTEDVAAVAAAVRGASHKAPAETPPNYGAMSQSEFEKEKAKYL